MLYCGLSLSPSAFTALILSGGFAPLDRRVFHISEQKPEPLFQNWLNSFKQNPQEPCLFFFDESEFEKYPYAHQLFLPITEPDKIYLIDRRKILDMIQFLRTRIEVDFAFHLSIDQPEYVLASAVRIFDIDKAN